jgi:hopene-associated glycosyltransferase HpnB
MFVFYLLSLIPLGAWIYLATAHGAFWQILLPEQAPEPKELPSVDIIVPARNESEALPHSLPSLLNQDYKGVWQVILVDDHSHDGTADIAKRIAADLGKENHLKIVSAPDLQAGWSGKVAAMNAGVSQSVSDMVLFTDADIAHVSFSLSRLVARAQSTKSDLVSRMVLLNCHSLAEKLLIPAFVFFFAMLYPFRRTNNSLYHTAAAAGGTMLVRRSMLNKIGGMAAIKSALIDDCSLASVMKSHGGKIELTLTRDIQSLRPYPHLRDVCQMVARSAYTQLRYSPIILCGTLIGMAILYILPLLLFLFSPSLEATIAGLLAYLIMVVIYLPMIRFYGLPWLWALTLPIAALVYGLATLDSARLYYQGKGGQWKGRAQA